MYLLKRKILKLLFLIGKYFVFVLFVLAFVYLIYIFSNDIQFYEETISKVYKVPQRLTNGKYNGDYVSAIISARNVKISILAIIVSAIGSFLTFYAFLMQKKANEIHREEIKNEHIIASYEKLMDVHRDCVNHITLCDTIYGVASFHFLFYELKSIYIHITDKYPFLKDYEYTNYAVYISMVIFIHGINGDEKKDYLIIEPLKEKLPQIRDRVDYYGLAKELEDINKNFVKKRIAPRCFIFVKYRNKSEYPNLPTLYKGNLHRLSSYFKIFEAYAKLEEIPSKNTELHRKLFPTQLSIHESAILSFYFRYRFIEDGTCFNNEIVDLLTEQANHIPTFNIGHHQFYVNV